jgi:hypothetical protein
MSKFMEGQKKIENAVVSGYQKIEDTVVSGYKRIEGGVVGGYKKVEDHFVKTFLTPDEPTARQSDDAQPTACYTQADEAVIKHTLQGKGMKI